MATVTHGGSLPDSSNKTDFYNIIDTATVSGIVNADVSAAAAIADSKLAQITTASKVSGTALTSLSSVPSGAGVIPAVNLPNSIADSHLATISTAGKVSGAALTSLTSTPSGAGVIPIANLASGTPTGSKYIRDDGTLQAITLSNHSEFLARFTAVGTPCTFDLTGGFTTGTDFVSNVFTVPTTGKYYFTFQLQWTKDATATQRAPTITIRKGGAAVSVALLTTAVNGGIYTMTTSILLNLTAADAIDTVVSADSGAFLASDITKSYFCGFLIR